MPYRSARPCAYAGCPNLVTATRYCETHAKLVTADYDAKRGTSAQRGYGARWARLRAIVLAKHPLCADPDGFHRLHGEVVAATDVDHIIPKSRGGQDIESNLQALCHAHHSHKTAAKDGGYGRV